MRPLSTKLRQRMRTLKHKLHPHAWKMRTLRQTYVINGVNPEGQHMARQHETRKRVAQLEPS